MNRKKIIIVLIIVAVLAAIGYVLFLIIDKSKNQDTDPQPNEEALVIPYEEKVAQTLSEFDKKMNDSYEYNESEVGILIEYVQRLLIMDRVDDGLKYISKIPDSVNVDVLESKYRITLNAYARKNDETNYSSIRIKYKSLLKELSEKGDERAKEILQYFDELYPEKIINPTEQGDGEPNATDS